MVLLLSQRKGDKTTTLRKTLLALAIAVAAISKLERLKAF
jgi:hypothetical protein